VREQTQELASWALGESPSLRPSGIYASTSDSALDGRIPPLSALSDSEQGDTRTSIDSSRPDIIDDVIEEVSEPVSPEGEGSSAIAGHASGLSNLMKDRRSRGRDGDSIAVESFSEFDQRSGPSVFIDDVETGEVTEASPLLPRERLPGRSYNTNPKDAGHRVSRHIKMKKRWAKIKYEFDSLVYTVSHPRDWDAKQMAHDGLGAVAAVFLGLLLNILDALSYGESAAQVDASLQSNCTICRHDSVPTRRGDFREDWSGWHFHVLR
jgi:SulP family sulfate permease